MSPTESWTAPRPGPEPGDRHAETTSFAFGAPVPRDLSSVPAQGPAVDDGPVELAEFPHHARLESAFGRSLGGAGVVDPEACRARSVRAFTDRRTTFFDSPTPSLHVAAHEAVHLLQSSGAVTDAGLGAERHAGTVANRVIDGRAAAPLLHAPGRLVPEVTRDYAELPESFIGDWAAGAPLRVSEDGRMAVAQNDAVQHDMWAEPGMISTSNATLTSRKSVIRLRALGDTLEGPAPDGTGPRRLSKVEPENVATSSSGDRMNLWADCGRSARDVMGAGEGTGWNAGRMTTKYTGVDRPWYTRIPIIGPLFRSRIKRASRTTSASDPEGMRDEVLSNRLGGSGSEALERRGAMSAADRDRFDRETGINRYAAPDVAGGYTMASGGKSHPGVRTWNFHWAGVIMVSNQDRVTLENYAVGNANAVNDRWRFEMYGGPGKPGQTFHEQHEASRQHGDMPTTLPVKVR